MTEMVEIGSGPNAYRVRGWLKELGGRFDFDRRVWLVPSTWHWEARNIIDHGGPLRMPSITPLLDVDGEWNGNDNEDADEQAPIEPEPIGVPELLLISRKALTFIEDGLRFGFWNQREAEVFMNARQRLIETGHGIANLDHAYLKFQKRGERLPRR